MPQTNAPSYLIYDCEIIRCIPDGSTRRPDLEYCEGWNDFGNMGISVIGFYSSLNGNTAKTLTDATPELSNFKSWAATARYNHDFVIGFNSRGFDDRLLLANDIVLNTDYDLLEEVRIAAGFTASYTSVPKGRSYSLAALALANGERKSGSGELAPVLWQEGKKQEVIDYCRHDVEITFNLLRLGLSGQLRDPNTDEKLTLRQLTAAPN